MFLKIYAITQVVWLIVALAVFKKFACKKWYCPHCESFKTFARVNAGVMGYPDTYHCRSCNTKMLHVKYLADVACKKVTPSPTKAVSVVQEHTGEWILDIRPGKSFNISGFHCSECGNFFMGKTKFCSNCGAKMQNV